MKPGEFKKQLGELTAEDLAAIAAGKGLFMINDETLTVADRGPPNCIELPPFSDLDELQQQAEAIHSDYYRSNPLSMTGFNRQLERLLETEGAASFAAVPGSLPRFTLFVEGGELIAETDDNPRFRYGIYLELERPLAEPQLESAVQLWLSSGDAYRHYISSNVCRYNC